MIKIKSRLFAVVLDIELVLAVMYPMQIMARAHHIKLEEQILTRKHRIADLRRTLAGKEKKINALSHRVQAKQAAIVKDTKRQQSVTRSSLPARKLTCKDLKKLAGKSIERTPLDMLLGAAGMEQSSGLGPQISPEVNFGFGSKLYVNAVPNERQAGITQCQSNEQLQEKVQRPEVSFGKQTVTFDSRNVNSLGADDQSNLFLRPKIDKTNLNIVDFVDRIFQTGNEKLLAEDETTQLFLNYGPKRVSLENVSVPQYLIASIRILYTLIETGQIRDFAGIKQYLAYIVKCIELATRYQWRSVLEYDDYFRQLQARHGLSWTHVIICIV